MTLYPERPPLTIVTDTKGNFDPSQKTPSLGLRLAYEAKAIEIDKALTVDGIVLDHSLWTLAVNPGNALKATLTLDLGEFLRLLAAERAHQGQGKDLADIKKAVSTFIEDLNGRCAKLAQRNTAFREVSEELNRLKLGRQGALVRTVVEQQPIHFVVTLQPQIGGADQKDRFAIVPRISL